MNSKKNKKKLSKQEIAEQKKIRKQRLRELGDDVKGFNEVINQHIGESKHYLASQSCNRSKAKGSMSQERGMREVGVGDNEPLIRFENSQIPHHPSVVTEPWTEVKQQPCYESDNQASKSPKTRGNGKSSNPFPFK